MHSKAQYWFNLFYERQQWEAHAFQQEVAAGVWAGKSGLLVAPTGSGKTLALFLPFLIRFHLQSQSSKGLRLLWISPLRALSQDILLAMEAAARELEVPIRIGLRNGDTSAKQKLLQKKDMPEVLITTPETLHILLSQKGYPDLFRNLETVVVDEWHELLGTKRGVATELGLSRLRGLQPGLQVWGISATLGNKQEALEVLSRDGILVEAKLEKQLQVKCVIPPSLDRFTWAGHLGLYMMKRVLPIIRESNTTLVFANTRALSEKWYHGLLQEEPELAGQIALHHGSMDQETRSWVEQQLHLGKLKVVVCTSSLDLGVDFRPVDTVVQVGGPKGIARFLQRAGRSGHQPGALSRIWFLPTNALELMEAAALQEAIREDIMEQRRPLQMTLDVLAQYLVTLAVSEGFRPELVYLELKQTYAYAALDEEHWNWVLDFIRSGGKTLQAYDEYRKVEIDEEGIYRVKDRRTAMRHRFSIGTIVADPMVKLRKMRGGYVGMVEESFIARMKPGNTFWFAGQAWELVKVNYLTAFVKPSLRDKASIPSFAGGRMPLSSQMAGLFRKLVAAGAVGVFEGPEMQAIAPLLKLQQQWSHLPLEDELLIETLHSKEGHHVFFYCFEGRMVHELLAALLSYRISRIQPISFSFAMNDYGFELLSDQPIPLEEALEEDVFSPENLVVDLMMALNESEMAMRKFREIAAIAGLLFMGYPGKQISYKHLQASTELIYKVFTQYEPDHKLVQQSFREVVNLELEQSRLVETLRRLSSQKKVIRHLEQPGPFAFPIVVDNLRAQLSSESLEDRIRKMSLILEEMATDVAQSG